jgi:patatin-like phospholipase/acyl hydrolase
MYLKNKNTMSKPLNILSIDGGGIRGIIPARILAYLESRIRSTFPDYHLCDSFDLISGTSTGGIIAMGLLTPVRETGKPRYRAEELAGLYVQHGAGIFNKNFLRMLTTGKGMLDETYRADYLEGLFEEYFGDIRLAELLLPCLITSYDVLHRKATFFNQYDAQQNIMADYLVRDIARATSAAPTYFEPAYFHGVNSDSKSPYIDGGIFANNPALCAIVELSKIQAARNNGNGFVLDLSHVHVLSLSTGTSREGLRKYRYEDVKDFGKIEWASPLIDMMMSANSETVHHQIATIFNCTGNADNYTRVDVELHKACPDMDDASDQNIRDLQEDADYYIEYHQHELDEIVSKLIAGIDTGMTEVINPDALAAEV